MAGPVAGVTATSFNGTSSWMPLDGAWCATAGQVSSCKSIPDTGRVLTGSTADSLAVSVWFKTSTAPAVLLSMEGSLPASCSPACAGIGASLLSIASNGDLQGYNGSGSVMSSPSPVDNGAWHQAVLIPGQALYLDGVKIATSTAGWSAPTATYVVLGAGMVPYQQNPQYSTWEYFSGSMADLSIYHDQLPSSGTVAAQYAAETTPAAELSSVTSPAGRTELSAAYDTVNDRVRSLTDAAGGTWGYSGLVTGASTAGYDGAVLGSSPEDFWPLDDASGPLAQDLVGSAATSASPRPTATYANVTLGVAGPQGFAHGNAASFNGTSSQVSIPGGYFAGTGAETAELWFSTKAKGDLLSTGSGPSGGEPMALWVYPDGYGHICLEGMIGTTVVAAAYDGECLSADVADGNWHQAVLTLSAGSTCPQGSSTCTPGSFVQTATLYQDGTALVSAQITTPATASATGYTAYLGSGPNAGRANQPDGDFTGSIADVSFYTTELSSTQVTAHYDALKSQDVPSGVTAASPVNTQTVTVTDPLGKTAAYTYASRALIQTTSVFGGVTTYGYDAADRAVTITDPDGDTTYMTYDAHNNVTSTTTCAAVNECQTSYASYYEDLSNPLDPRNDKPTDSRDARSSSSTDPTYDTVTTYTAAGQVATVSTPPTPACPSGCTTTNAFTKGTEAAVGGGTEPAGLLASVTSPGGGVTSYAYDAAGDVMTVTDPLGLVTKYTYDNVGRELTQTQVSNSYPAGLTTSFAYDSLGRLATETDPPVTDRVTGAVHTEVIGYAYDADGNVLTTTLSDATGGDPARTTTDTYNSDGELATETDALGNTTSYTYDALGDRVTVTDPAGQVTAYAYDAAGDLLTTTLQGYTGNPSDPIPAENLVQESWAYDPAGRLASVTDVMGTTTAYTYYGDNLLASSYIVCSSCSTGMSHATTYGFDPAGNVVTETSPGSLVTNTVYNADDQIVSQMEDPSGADRTISNSYDPNGNVVSQSLTGGGVTQTSTATYNALGQELTQTDDNTGGNLTTSVTRDQRGLVTSETDPDGNTTTIQNDEDGRPVVVTGPAVQAENGNGGAPVTANPVAMAGYDTFGDEVEDSDPDGNVTTAAYDTDGRQVSVTDPSYTPPGSSTPVGGTTAMTYNKLGEETKITDPVGNVTQFSYDQLGDLASQTDPDGVWTYTYDPAEDPTSVTDPTGAQTQATYDNLGEQLTSTDLIRQNTSAAYTTSYAYNDAGEQVSQTTPTGVTTTAAYDPLGEMISSTDGAGNTTSYAYNLDGDLTKITAPDGTATTTTYDLAGRPTSVSDLSSSGAVLRTASAAYDADGDVTSMTDFLGDTTTAKYDATGMLTSQTQPTSASNSITVSYGYDLAGNPTAVTDGNGNTTYATYNSLGLPQTITEPPTVAYTSTANSTTTDIYDGDGNPVTQDLPGGVQISSTYDPDGDLTGQSGTGAAAPTATRAFTYDAAGRLLTAATSAAGTSGLPGYQPATSESFSYDDRGLLLSASGSAGTSTFTYNASAQLASATDAAGTSRYTYDSAGRLATDADAASGTTGTYSYNSLDQVTGISYGSGNDTQKFGYDSLHRLTSDAISTASGAQVAAIGYGYDADNDITSMTTSGLATGGGTGTLTNTYGYDQANRLTSWTAAPVGGQSVTKTYGYDNDGNLTSNNGTTYSYDARDELTSDGSNSYAYTADGDLASQTGPGGAKTFASDAYGQQITDAASSPTWDALGRVVSAANSGGTSITLTYDGMTGEVASDSSASYSRDPAGQVVGVDSTSGGKTLALVNQHNDLSATFTAAGAAMTSSATWDPWGNPIAAAGPAVELGYQGQWTDPATGQTNMGSRFYKPATGGFINADTAPAGNPYAYAGDNPVTVTDPTGHDPSGGGTGNGTITQADVNAAAARAQDAQQAAARAETAAATARETAAHAQATASAAVSYADELNGAASQLYRQWELADQAAQQAAAQAARVLAAAQDELQKAESENPGPQPQAPSGTAAGGGTSGGTTTSCAEIFTGLGMACALVLGSAGGTASTVGSLEQENEYWLELQAWKAKEAAYLQDLGVADAEFVEYAIDEADAAQLKVAADVLWGQYAAARSRADAAGRQAQIDAWFASEAEATARALTADADAAEKTAAAAEAGYQKLKAEYEQEQRQEHQHKAQQGDNKQQAGTANSAPPASSGQGGGAPGGGCSPGPQQDSGSQQGWCRQAAAEAARAVTATAQATVSALASIVGSGLNSIPSCVTHPTAASCLEAAATAILLIGTAFADVGSESEMAADPAASGVSITQRLQQHVAQAVSDFDNGILTMSPNQARAAASNPALSEAYRGQVIDTAAKAAVSRDPMLSSIYVTRSGELGPDFLDLDSLPGTPQWWDITTSSQWAQHLSRYAGFGNGIPLFTR